MAQLEISGTVRKKIGYVLGILGFFVPYVFPLPEGLSLEGYRLLGITLLMAVWWLTEAQNLAVTALMPLALFPLLQIDSMKSTAANYANPNIFLFFGGFMLAMAMQRWNLHKRIALFVISIVGGGYRRLIAGFMVATATISMWVSNTATTMMLLPIGLAVIDQISRDSNEEENSFASVLMLGIAYSASIGGTATIIGTPPNVILVGQMTSLLPDVPPIHFVQWLLFALPLAMGLLFIVWLYLSFVVFRPSSEKEFQSSIIEEERQALGPISKEEKAVMCIFIFTAFSWISRSDIVLSGFTIPGWASLFGLKGLHDGTVAILSALLLFSFPVDFSKREFLLNWDWAQKIPWGILLLFGGGFALANGFKTTGLAVWISQLLTVLEGTSPIVIVFGLCLSCTFLTEITSNTATATLLIPIVAALGKTMGIDPLLLMIPTALSCSLAFMLPVATPPNAIVFGSEKVSIPQMAKAGFAINILGAIWVTLFMKFYSGYVFSVSL